MSRRYLTTALALFALAAPMAASAQYGGTRTVRCESDNNRTEVCRVDTRGGVRLIDQTSRAACIQGRTWGADNRGIWVTGGCRGKFRVGDSYVASRGSATRYPSYGSRGYNDPYYGSSYPNSGYYGGNSGYYGSSYPNSGYYGGNSGYYGSSYPNSGYGTGSSGYGMGRYDNPITAILGAVLGGSGGGGYDNRYYGGRQPQTFRCESIDGYPRFCRLPFEASRIDIRRQLSSTRCEQNNNWGWQRDGVWVERGCRAEFIVY